MAEPLFFNQDVGVLLQFTLTKPDGTALNVTGGTVTLIVESVGSFACTITDGTAGKVEKSVASGEFSVGSYRSQIRAVIGGSTFHTLVFRIQVGTTVAGGGPATPGDLPFNDSEGDPIIVDDNPAADGTSSFGARRDHKHARAIVTVASGGVGISSYTTGDLLYASGTTALNRLAAVTAGSYLRSQGVGTAPGWSTLALPDSATVGSLAAATSTDALGTLAAVADGNVLRSAGTGTLPVWGKVRLDGSPTDITGVLALANGGTGFSTPGAANTLMGINSGGSSYEFKSLLGTSNQVVVTHGTGTVTLSTPQNIHSGATPAFTALRMGSNPASVGTVRLPNDGSLYFRNLANTGDSGRIISQETGSIATGTTFDLDPSGILNPACHVFISSTGGGAHLYLHGSVGLSLFNAHPSANWGTSPGAAAHNVYWLTDRYKLQNNSGGNARYQIFYLQIF